MAMDTGRGDSGETVLPSLGPVSKSHPRVEIDGLVDEINSLVGAARPTGYDDVDEHLRTIQHHLHVLHADVTNPDPPEDHPAVTGGHVSTLEHWIDSYAGVGAVMSQHTTPGGTGAGSRLHLARSVCQRAERRAVRLLDRSEGNEHVVRYLNRLADVLFIFARVVNERSGRSERVQIPDGTTRPNDKRREGRQHDEAE